MGRLITATLLACLTFTQALPQGQTRPQTQPQESGAKLNTRLDNIKWGPCEYAHNSNGVAIECGTLAVPLDYTKLDPGQLNLDLIKINATKGPFLGSMLFNPGGPGESGIAFLTDWSKEWVVLSGGQYDLIGFDPRGTGRTMPFTCPESEQNQTKTLQTRSTTLFTKPLTDVLAEQWPIMVEFSELCYSKFAETGHLYGTTFVARDMLEISKATNSDGLLRYYGVSYGTILGWTFASMFPDRVERMVLDGNINPHEYWGGYDTESTSNSDEAFFGMINGCVASPHACTLATKGDARTIVELINAKFKALAAQPITVETGDAASPEVTISYQDVRMKITNGLYAPGEWVTTTQILQLFLDNSNLALAQVLGLYVAPETATQATRTAEKASLVQRQEPAPVAETPGNVTEPTVAEEKWNQGAHGLQGITCGDWPLRASKPEELSTLISLQQPISAFVDTVAKDYWKCLTWKMRAAERYAGDFSAQTKVPVLFLNPTWDPITPLVSARNASSTLPGSVVLEHRGYGHGTFAQGSLCTSKIMRQYYMTGILPAPQTVCQVDIPLFSNTTYAELVTTLETRSLVDRSAADDIELFKATHAMQSFVPKRH